MTNIIATSFRAINNMNLESSRKKIFCSVFAIPKKLKEKKENSNVRLKFQTWPANCWKIATVDPLEAHRDQNRN